MATQVYRLTFVLRLTGSDAGTTQQAVTIAAPSMDEALELAQFYRAGLPSDAIASARLIDMAGEVIWSEQDSNASDGVTLRKDQP
ncbi:hypothetical protein MKK84_28415 [Methylobacterium sp. E-065]|uniref:hypothetical protein n=1 Tax=Methylobacterium sp. E-065 TaxID=2836583 RepID=UPI001FBADB05|nr:hypothetical protein [Methylobacterium sp. E-065]MCJ2021295.1 hypothetical protein [Methylobacterium sp. E-065]